MRMGETVGRWQGLPWSVGMVRPRWVDQEAGVAAVGRRGAMVV